jgi:hypothetical protein
MLTTPELVHLLGRDYAWFETKRRRTREQIDLKKIKDGERWPTVGHDADLLPVKDVFGGRWAKYDAEDAILMALAIEGEDRGLTFKAAAKMADNSGAAQVLTRPLTEPDLWIGKAIDADECTSHLCGSWAEITRQVAKKADIQADVFLLNASAILRRLRKRAAELGLLHVFDAETE